MNRNGYCQVIAEAGVNHNGDLNLALELVDVAAEAGADIVKFQTFSASQLASHQARKVSYQQKASPLKSETQLEMLQRLELSHTQHQAVQVRCAERNIQFLSSCFDLQSLDFLEDNLHASGHKLGSGELTNAPLLLAVGRTKKPLILSTGMANLGEIEQALGVLAFGYAGGEERPSIEAFTQSWQDPDKRAIVQDKVILLHCTTEYPAPIEMVNLNVMETLHRAFGMKVGYSDHTIGATAAIAAVALGASVIEKHITLDSSLPGPDHKASMEPAAFKEMVKAIRDTKLAMGHAIKSPGKIELNNMREVRKSLVATANIKRGETFSTDNLGIKRPGYGRSPYDYWSLLGEKASRGYDKDECI